MLYALSLSYLLALHEPAWTNLGKTHVLRIIAVVAMAAALGSIGTALTHFNTWSSQLTSGTIKVPKRFIRDWFNRFLQTGSIYDSSRSGRPPKVPDSVAKEAANILKQGYPVTWYPKFGAAVQVTCRKYYTSIKHACRHNQRLRQICDDYHISPAKLLVRMHQVDPYLKFMRLHYMAV